MVLRNSACAEAGLMVEMTVLSFDQVRECVDVGRVELITVNALKLCKLYGTTRFVCRGASPPPQWLGE